MLIGMVCCDVLSVVVFFWWGFFVLVVNDVVVEWGVGGVGIVNNLHVFDVVSEHKTIISDVVDEL